MAEVVLKDVVKTYGETVAVDSVSLTVKNGELLALLGASGCGKTTILRILAGFEEIDSGSVCAGEKVFSSGSVHVSAENRNVGVVFQSYALWPHMTVAENVEYPLKVDGIKNGNRKLRVDEALETVGLSGRGECRPAELSGGQRQRVALARCLVMKPDVVLLDEPLANLDVHLRESMLHEFKEFHAQTEATMVFVTHDQSEAMAIADRIAVMDSGRLLQVSSPCELYECPATVQVARFIGRGSVIPVNVTACADGKCEIELEGYHAKVRCPADTATGECLCAFKGEWLNLDNDGLRCSVVRSVYRGGQTALELRICSLPDNCDVVRLNISGYKKMSPGETVCVTIADGWILPLHSQ
ncbi:ABC transporter ATP-binding protein [Desulfovibrio gilichinskyi]|uniref:Carbohydrate ABC transporter ATP-binding protein, CUT1 family n=1 Tax=Desulfovibrio gilichinskyi TaxID=1519643 RepID=A0A1X7ENQ5_9BACT|nr:ABC transporter ATP-binding protein [Desulfovibrio gilichinskyi]SMF37150.1 carbohydrate ABC transporter ATP-binding protein, CUT1 family [Desulfovibrio gilichinskyi]